MRYYQIFPRINRLIGLELFVFTSFLGICAIINALLVEFPDSENPFWNVILAGMQIGLSMLLVGVWLVIWYILTRRLMKQKNEDVDENNQSEA